MHLYILRSFLATMSRGSNAASRSPDLHFHLKLCVRILLTHRSRWFRRSSISKPIRSIDIRLLAIESCLAWLYRALTVDFGGSGRDFFLLYFFVRDSLWNDIDKKLEIVEM